MLTKKEWIAVAAGIVIIIIFLGSRFLNSDPSQAKIDVQNQINNRTKSIDVTTSDATTSDQTVNVNIKNTNVTVKTKTMDQNKSAGLVVKDVVVGTGAEAKNGNLVSVQYTGKFADGKVFDSSIPRGKPIEFQLGAGMVIPGWDQGILGMKVGGKRTLVIPSDLAYGPNDYNGIPGGSTLYFDVELVGVKVQ